MTERWRESLAALGRTRPDKTRLRTMASVGPRMPDPGSSIGPRITAALIALTIAGGAFAFAWSAFGHEGAEPLSGSTTATSTEPDSDALSCESSGFMSMIIELSGEGTDKTEIDALKTVLQTDVSLQKLGIDPSTVGEGSGPNRTVQFDGKEEDPVTEWLVYSNDLAVFRATVQELPDGGFSVSEWDACV